MLEFRKHFSGIVIAVSVYACVAAPANSAAIPSEVIDALLAQGGWSARGDDDQKSERLEVALIQRLIRDAATDQRTIGLLSLSLSAAKWGVRPNTSIQSDPAADAWRGPSRKSGKHLMSYLIGGVGLPHLDVGHLAKFLDYLLSKHASIGSIQEQTRIRKFAEVLRTGTKYDQIKNDAVFRKWMLEGLRQRDAQEWVLNYWLDNFWAPALEASQGDVRLALVVARIWNTSPRLGACAAKRALKSSDRVAAALQAYVDCPGGSAAYKTRRWGWMRRPVVLFDQFYPNANQPNP